MCCVAPVRIVLMADKTVLRGMTWDHSRGYDPMVATSEHYMREHPDVSISWDKRSLQEFADRPLDDMARQYDLMVIDHPHVGDAARGGLLLALDEAGYAAQLDTLAAQSVGASHRSYEFDGHQWALAIDAATPVASFRPDLLAEPPSRWEDVLDLARHREAGFALIPINALMTFFGLARNLGFAIAQTPDTLIERDCGRQVLDELCKVAALVDPRCLKLDPIGILEWMGRRAEAPAYCPFGYGYTNYSRDGYCEYPVEFIDAPGFGANGPGGTVLGGTGIAVSAATRSTTVAVDYAFWIASATCQAGLYFTAGGQPANAVAWDSPACNAACGNFFTNTRRTLDSAWLRPRYAGYMQLQDAASKIVHDCLLGKTGIDDALTQLDCAYVASRQ